MANRRKLLLLDGHSLAYRAFFALPETLVTSSGQVTNAVYGFTSMLIKLIGDEKPSGVAVCFDRGRPAFRHERFTEYKANRREQPDTLREQFGLIREVLQAMRITIVDLEGYEADDLLATLAREATEDGDEVVIISGDRDVLQLVTDGGVSVMMTRRGISDIVRYDEKAVFERYGVTPAQWTDFVALKGETSDNLPGVPGIGDKTAAKLIQTYGDIDGVIANADALTPKMRSGVTEMAEQVRINKELGHLLTDVPLSTGPEDIALISWDDEQVRALFTSLEFNSLYERLKELDLSGAPAAEPAVLELESKKALSGAPDSGAAIAWDAATRWMAVSEQAGKASVVGFEEGITTLKTWLADPDKPKQAHDAKLLYRRALDAGRSVDGLATDTMLAAYVLEPGLPGGYELADVVQRHLGVTMTAEPETKKKGKQATLDLEDDGGEAAARAAAVVLALAPVLEEKLRHRGMWELATSLEFPLVGVLSRMEYAGVLIDRDYLEELNDDLGAKMSALERQICDRAGEPFNVNSNLQLQKVLFEQLGLPKTKKIKTGWSTDQSEMAKIRDAHPIVGELIEYREVAKLKTGFTDALLPLINPKTKRIHTTYLQTSASTGRLASTNPNLQNIPIRGDLGRQIRRAFVAPEGSRLLSADYSQIELRVLAHLSEDAGFLEAFASGHDFHAAIAAKVYDCEPEAVTSQQRAYAKQFSFGIAYGMSAFGVSERLGIERDEAQGFIDAYYAQFPDLKEFLDAQVRQAVADGYTTTIFGRRRYIPELGSSNFRIRAMGERMALNAPIQGSAADIIKRAMIEVDRRFVADPSLGRMLMSVHDELVFELPEDGVDEATSVVRELMEGAADLRATLTADVRTGRTWSDAHA